MVYKGKEAMCKKVNQIVNRAEQSGICLKNNGFYTTVPRFEPWHSCMMSASYAFSRVKPPSNG